MPFTSGAILGLQTATQYISQQEAEKLKARNQQAAKDRNGITPEPDLGYSAVRGLLAEKGFENNANRILVFQFNPETIADAKTNNYEAKAYTGFSFNDQIWGSGGERTISFKLNFEATAGANTPTFSKVRKTSDLAGQSTWNTLESNFPNGTLPDVELLQSFQYPKQQDPNKPRFTNGGFIPSPKFMPPPVVVFVYGNYYLEGIIADVSVEHQLFNKKLIPLRSECQVTFKVLEMNQVIVKNIPTGRDVNAFQNTSNISSNNGDANTSLPT